MNRTLAFLAGMGTGAGLTFLMDPDRGRRRRKLAGDRARRMAHFAGDSVEDTARDVRNRSLGRLHVLRTRLRPEAVDDVVLVERVRSAMGRMITHPSAIEVSAAGGSVTLRGPIPRDEVDGLLDCAASVRGVRSINNELDVHERAGDVPGLQGGGARPGRRPDVVQEHWSPTTRLVAGAAGSGIALWGLTRGGRWGPLAGLAGLGLFTRAATNLRPERLIGLGAGRRAIDVHKTITVLAPVEEVYAYWSNVKNFPRIMAHVLDVRDHGRGRSHWKVAGPAGIPVGFEAVVTKREPNRILAWKTLPGQSVRHAGIIHFEPAAGGGTRLDIRMSYNPPAGAIGHAVASFFGSDPKRAMDDDLVRFKSLIEQGKTTVHGRETMRADVPPAQAPQLATAGARTAAGRQPRERGMPGGGQGRTDEVGHSGVYPASGPLPSGEAPVRTQAEWGQGDRGAAGAKDSGRSEIIPRGEGGSTKQAGPR